MSASAAVDRHDGAAVVELADGGQVLLRPLTPGDGPALLRFHEDLSEQSRYRRFLSPHPHLTESEVRHLTVLEHPARVAYAVESGDDLIAIGRYEGDGDRAEVAFTVADEHQGRGIGTILLAVLAECARSHGIRAFFADVLCENTAMLHVFRDAGFDLHSELDAGVVRVTFELEPPA
jgi:GNAT superfamily N-acetyltransferase